MWIRYTVPFGNNLLWSNTRSTWQSWCKATKLVWI